MMRQISAIAAVLASAQAAYDQSPLVPMRDYQDNFRTLSGWECFEAEGKFCHDKNHASMISVTGSSNFGHGVCCKPGFSGEHCNNDGDHTCSQPVAAQDTSAEFTNVLTNGKNHQMFAFLPKTSPKMCGISTTQAEDVEGSMKINADLTKQSISLVGDTALQYIEGRPDVRSYDSCFYEIGSKVENTPLAENSTESSEQEDLKIIINLTKLKNMNVFVYEGKDRYSATRSVNGNQQLLAGRNYTVPVSKGMLLIAYPNKGLETEFEFDYYVAPVENLLDTLKNFNFEGEQGHKALAIVIGVAAAALLLVCSCVICLARKQKNQNNKIENKTNPNAAPKMELASGESSLQDVDQAVNTETEKDESKQRIKVIDADGEK